MRMRSIDTYVKAEEGDEVISAYYLKEDPKKL
jgi:hypothetical protein